MNNWLTLTKGNINRMKEPKNLIGRLEFFINGPESYDIEHKLFNVVGFTGGVIGVITVLINFIVDSPFILSSLSLFVTLACVATFYISRVKGNFNLGRWILTPSLFITFDVIFFENNGSYGPLLNLYTVFFMALLFVWHGKARLFFVALFFLNIIAFFIVELKFPYLIDPYLDDTNRLIDIYLSYILYVTLAGVLLVFAKNGYIRESRKAKKSDNLKSAFLANMSHEIRTPMNAILGFTQLLHKDLSREKKEAYIKVITDNTHSLLRLIEDIIDVSKIEAGELAIREMECNPSSLVEEVSATFRQILMDYPDRNIRIIEQMPLQERLILADGIRLKQVLSNLVSNAIKYTENGIIAVGYEKHGDTLQFFVKDNGAGIREEHLEEVFDRFRKIETDDSIKIQPGTGIGLSICKNLVRLMGGEIRVKSEFGKGSEFFFTVPFKPTGSPIIKQEVVFTARDLDKINFEGKTVLIAEDERTNLAFLRKVIERTGAEILHASDGREAIDIFEKNNHIDLVLMDMMMPEVDGFEAAGIIKLIRPDVPIIAQTALAMEGDAAKILESGCDDYISKPIRIHDLMSKVCKYMSSNAPSESERSLINNC